MTRRIGRTDTNQTEIVNALRGIGAFVQFTHTIGNGAPDIFVLFRGRWTPIEIKYSGGKLTDDEREWWEAAGYDEPIIARSDQDALRIICGDPLGLFPRVDNEQLVPETR